MRVSNSQIDLLVSFMESHGDLSKPNSGPQGRILNYKLWGELASLLNADPTGEEKSEEKWKRTWSDLKNNTKRKAAKIAQSAKKTGGGPPSKIKLNEHELRIIEIINPRAATGDEEVAEVGLQIEQETLGLPSQTPPPQLATTPSPAKSAATQQYDVEDWNAAGSSQDPPKFPSTNRHYPLSATPRRDPRRDSRPTLQARLTPRPTKRQRRSPVRARNRQITRSDQATEHFLKADMEWRELQAHQERERIRIRELEIQMQTRWQDLLAEFLLLLQNYLDNKNK